MLESDPREGEMPRDQYLALAIRRNRGERLRADWMARLALACAFEIHSEYFLSLEETDGIRKRFTSKLKRPGTFRKNWPRGSVNAIAELIKNLSITLRSQPVLLFSSVDYYVGAVVVPAHVLLVNFLAVWEVVGEDFRVVTPDLGSGLCVGVEYYDAKGKYVKGGVYEGIAWGIFATMGMSQPPYAI